MFRSRLFFRPFAREEERERERAILILENLSFSLEGFALGFSVASDLGIIDGKAIALNVIQLGPVVCFVVAFGFCVVYYVVFR